MLVLESDDSSGTSWLSRSPTLSDFDRFTVGRLSDRRLVLVTTSVPATIDAIADDDCRALIFLRESDLLIFGLASTIFDIRRL